MTSISGKTKRIKPTQQSLEEAYSAPANMLEIEVGNPQTHGLIGSKRFTDYEVRVKTNLPIFEKRESKVRRRYSDFVWLRNEIKNAVKINLPEMPGKAISKQLFPFLNTDDGIFEENFIEERRAGLEEFINVLARHPLVQGEKSLHLFLQSDGILDKGNYVSGKMVH